MPSVGFARPEALPLLAAVALLAALGAWSEVRRTRALAAFAGRGADLASVSASRRRAKLALALGAAAVAAIALAGPYVDVVKRRVVQSGVDLVVALDVSQSMATRDVDPDRLRLAKQAIQRLGEGLTQSRVSLVLFAGDGIVRYPPTDDPSVLGQTLDAVNPAFKPQGGSSLPAAIDAALLAFSDEARQSARHKAVILVTDGEDLSGRSPDLETLRQRGVRVFTIGVGTVAGGPIPVYDRSGKFLSYLKRANGEQIVSHMEEQPLRTLAERTDGKYWHLTSVVQTVNDLSTELKRLDATQLGELDAGSLPDDRYQIPLALALAALIADGLLTERRDMPRPGWLRAPSSRARRGTRIPAFVRAAAPWLLIVALLGACSGISTSEADRLYLAGDARGALERYRALLAEHPEIAELHVNTGNALYQLAQYPNALEEYAPAVRDGAPNVRAVADYQKGDTLFRMGKLEEAREAFKDALRIDPTDRDAKFNIEVIDRAIEVTEERSGEGQPQPGQSGRPNPGDQQGQNSGPNASGQQQSPTGQQQGRTGADAPQTGGPPTTDSDQTGQSVTDALRQFRSDLTPDEALKLLDALQSEQRGIQQLIEGVPQQQQRGPGQAAQDPTY
jgi:Ca-activated chloride channel homolog